ncbi:MAG: very short patch repair endonuclease [candidate division WOR-3 bacterium]
MTDVLTKEQRSFNMSQIKGKNTKPEVLLRRLLYSKGIRGYRIHYKLSGKPDVVFTKKKIAIFIDGCFWHKCPVCFITPETRTEFWMKKIEDNVKRDKTVNKKLEKEGWTVLRFWEHEIKKSPGSVVSKIIRWLK